MKKHWLVLGTLLPLLAAGAADAQTLRLTVGEAVDRPMQTSHRLAEAIAREAGAHATVRVRESADQPTVNLSGGYTRTNHVEEFRVLQPGELRVIYPDVPDNVFSRLALQWPIYTGGRTDALQRAAEAEARAAGSDVNAARADLRLEVVRSYWALATANESLRVLSEALSRADAHVRDVRAQFDNGLIPPNDVSSAEAQRSRQLVQQIEARNFRSSAMEDLRRLTGVTEEIEIAEQLEAAAQPGTTATPEASARAERQAQAERIVAADELRRAAEAGRRPTVSFTSAVDYANPNPRIFPRAEKWQESWEVGVTASWTLWDGGRTAAEIQEADAAATAARARLDELDSLFALEIRQRSLDLDSARAALVAAGDGVRSAAEARRVVAERFALGVTTSIEVLDAQLALLQAELDRTRALAAIRLAEARLDRALGR